jgi:hypothetical protein
MSVNNAIKGASTLQQQLQLVELHSFMTLISSMLCYYYNCTVDMHSDTSTTVANTVNTNEYQQSSSVYHSLPQPRVPLCRVLM